MSLNYLVVLDFCRKWRITELSFFESALRGGLQWESRLGILVSFAPDGQWDLLDHMEMEEELSVLLGRPVDLLTRCSVERSGNPGWRESVLSHAEPFITV